MNQKVLKTLEFNKIIEKLVNKAISPMGKELCTQIVPITDYDEILALQKETTESSSIILKKGSLPLGGLKDVRASLKRVEMSGVLMIEELLHIGDFLYVARKTLNYGINDNKNETYELVEKYFDCIVLVPDLEKEITRCIANEQDLEDNASQKLYDIRKNIKTSNNRIKEQLNSIIHSATYKNMLQDNVITIRNGRYCVPVKQESRSGFQGMIHDQSSTGATLFIEPLSVVNLNNKIKELETEERNEINRILKKLSEAVEEKRDILETNIEILTKLDFIFAKGELSIMMNATQPIFNTKGYINIKKGRHPLLTGTVVPTDIYLGKTFTTLLITGPNTGGKTVSLKTLGLFTLMGQAGLHISAFDNSELNVFDNVYADIGDEQSIEQSLSTFSSHMTNIVKILSEVNCNCLVLLDELGAGTDPIEGAALAISILQSLHKKKVSCAVTTHYSELKVYALSTEGVENAACEFDVETLRPTYKLLIGIPGKSNAFAISRRLGLEEEIINDAREIISHENVKFEDIITDLEISKRTVEIEKDRAEQYRRESEKLNKELELQKDKLQANKEKIIAKSKEEARQIIQEAKAEADQLIRQLQKQIREQGSQKELDQTRNKLKDKLGKMDDELSENTIKHNTKPITTILKPGDKVFIHTLNQTGTVVSKQENNGNVMVQSGSMKVKIHVSKLSLDNTKEAKSKPSSSFVSNVKKGKSQNIRPEIDLRGNLVNESLELVDKYLDDACLSGINQVTIIHGKGTGALRSAIHDFLRKHSHVKSYRLGVFGEGESGVTVVELN